eukprot:jgi/Bigna1/86734/estExt_fgenesh1_pg.C_130100
MRLAAFVVIAEFDLRLITSREVFSLKNTLEGRRIVEGDSIRIDIDAPNRMVMVLHRYRKDQTDGKEATNYGTEAFSVPFDNSVIIQKSNPESLRITVNGFASVDRYYGNSYKIRANLEMPTDWTEGFVPESSLIPLKDVEDRALIKAAQQRYGALIKAKGSSEEELQEPSIEIRDARKMVAAFPEARLYCSNGCHDRSTFLQGLSFYSSICHRAKGTVHSKSNYCLVCGSNSSAIHACCGGCDFHTGNGSKCGGHESDVMEAKFSVRTKDVDGHAALFVRFLHDFNASGTLIKVTASGLALTHVKVFCRTKRGDSIVELKVSLWDTSAKKMLDFGEYDPQKKTEVAKEAKQKGSKISIDDVAVTVYMKRGFVLQKGVKYALMVTQKDGVFELESGMKTPGVGHCSCKQWSCKVTYPEQLRRHPSGESSSAWKFDTSQKLNFFSRTGPVQCCYFMLGHHPLPDDAESKEDTNDATDEKGLTTLPPYSPSQLCEVCMFKGKPDRNNETKCSICNCSTQMTTATHGTQRVTPYRDFTTLERVECWQCGYKSLGFVPECCACGAKTNLKLDQREITNMVLPRKGHGTALFIAVKDGVTSLSNRGRLELIPGKRVKNHIYLESLRFRKGDVIELVAAFVPGPGNRNTFVGLKRRDLYNSGVGSVGLLRKDAVRLTTVEERLVLLEQFERARTENYIPMRARRAFATTEKALKCTTCSEVGPMSLLHRKTCLPCVTKDGDGKRDNSSKDSKETALPSAIHSNVIHAEHQIRLATGKMKRDDERIPRPARMEITMGKADKDESKSVVQNGMYVSGIAVDLSANDMKKSRYHTNVTLEVEVTSPTGRNNKERAVLIRPRSTKDTPECEHLSLAISETEFVHSLPKGKEPGPMMRWERGKGSKFFIRPPLASEEDVSVINWLSKRMKRGAELVSIIDEKGRYLTSYAGGGKPACMMEATEESKSEERFRKSASFAMEKHNVESGSFSLTALIPDHGRAFLPFNPDIALTVQSYCEHSSKFFIQDYVDTKQLFLEEGLGLQGKTKSGGQAAAAGSFCFTFPSIEALPRIPHPVVPGAGDDNDDKKKESKKQKKKKRKKKGGKENSTNNSECVRLSMNPPVFLPPGAKATFRCYPVWNRQPCKPFEGPRTYRIGRKLGQANMSDNGSEMSGGTFSLTATDKRITHIFVVAADGRKEPIRERKGQHLRPDNVAVRGGDSSRSSRQWFRVSRPVLTERRYFLIRKAMVAGLRVGDVLFRDQLRRGHSEAKEQDGNLLHVYRPTFLASHHECLAGRHSLKASRVEKSFVCRYGEHKHEAGVIIEKCTKCAYYRCPRLALTSKPLGGETLVPATPRYHPAFPGRVFQRWRHKWGQGALRCAVSGKAIRPGEAIWVSQFEEDDRPYKQYNFPTKLMRHHYRQRYIRILDAHMPMYGSASGLVPGECLTPIPAEEVEELRLEARLGAVQSFDEERLGKLQREEELEASAARSIAHALASLGRRVCCELCSMEGTFERLVTECRDCKSGAWGHRLVELDMDAAEAKGDTHEAKAGGLTEIGTTLQDGDDEKAGKEEKWARLKGSNNVLRRWLSCLRLSTENGNTSAIESPAFPRPSGSFFVAHKDWKANSSHLATLWPGIDVDAARHSLHVKKGDVLRILSSPPNLTCIYAQVVKRADPKMAELDRKPRCKHGAVFSALRDNDKSNWSCQGKDGDGLCPRHMNTHTRGNRFCRAEECWSRCSLCEYCFSQAKKQLEGTAEPTKTSFSGLPRGFVPLAVLANYGFESEESSAFIATIEAETQRSRREKVKREEERRRKGEARREHSKRVEWIKQRHFVSVQRATKEQVVLGPTWEYSAQAEEWLDFMVGADSPAGISLLSVDLFVPKEKDITKGEYFDLRIYTADLPRQSRRRPLAQARYSSRVPLAGDDNADGSQSSITEDGRSNERFTLALPRPLSVRRGVWYTLRLLQISKRTASCENAAAFAFAEISHGRVADLTVRFRATTLQKDEKSGGTSARYGTFPALNFSCLAAHPPSAMLPKNLPESISSSPKLALGLVGAGRCTIVGIKPGSGGEWVGGEGLVPAVGEQNLIAVWKREGGEEGKALLGGMERGRIVFPRVAKHEIGEALKKALLAWEEDEKREGEVDARRRSRALRRQRARSASRSRSRSRGTEADSASDSERSGQASPARVRRRRRSGSRGGGSRGMKGFEEVASGKDEDADAQAAKYWTCELCKFGKNPDERESCLRCGAYGCLWVEEGAEEGGQVDLDVVEDGDEDEDEEGAENGIMGDISDQKGLTSSIGDAFGPNSMTGVYFECQLEACRTLTCLRCLKHVPPSQKMTHDCEGLMGVVTLYKDFLSILAKSSSQLCPKCGKPGLKDLACTHISCNCGAKWCYMCGKDFTGGFGNHNNWNNSNGLKKIGHCPQYLRAVYDKGKGSAETALRLFHMHKARMALDRFYISMTAEKKRNFPVMMERYFPEGILDKEDHKELMRVCKECFQEGDSAWAVQEKSIPMVIISHRSIGAAALLTVKAMTAMTKKIRKSRHGDKEVKARRWYASAGACYVRAHVAQQNQA